MAQATSSEATILDLAANLAKYPPALFPSARFLATDTPKTWTSNGAEWIAEGGAPATAAPSGVAVIGQGGEVTVPSTLVQAGSHLALTWAVPTGQLPGAAPDGALWPYKLIPGVSFEIHSSSGEIDNGKPVFWQLS